MVVWFGFAVCITLYACDGTDISQCGTECFMILLTRLNFIFMAIIYGSGNSFILCFFIYCGNFPGRTLCVITSIGNNVFDYLGLVTFLVLDWTYSA